MILLQKIRQTLLTISLVLLVSTFIGLGLFSGDSWAATSFSDLISPSPMQIAMMNKVKAVSKNIEGKGQEIYGNITGDPKDQVLGKAKQAESQVRNTIEDAGLSERSKAVSKNIEGKTQEAMGKVTGEPKDQVLGKAKQVESQVRNTIEDVKDNIQNILN